MYNSEQLNPLQEELLWMQELHTMGDRNPQFLHTQFNINKNYMPRLRER